MRILLFVICLLFYSSAFSAENIFYILHDKKELALNELSKHADLTHTLIAQSYQIDQAGNISGTVDPEVIEFAKKHPVKLLAMVTNSGFDSKKAHLFLTDPIAQKKALDALIEDCQKNQFHGIQFDFEMIALTDKDALTNFYQLAAENLHKNGLIISFAIAPTLTDSHFANLYQKKLYEVWQGAYDFKKLGEISDFVTIMAYDQHASGTTPGPTASAPWVEQVVKHALQLIPANKISLGVPTYSGLWYLTVNANSNRTTIRYDSISFQTANYILNKTDAQLHWDSQNKVHYTFYEKNGLNRYLFIEDAQSFKFKSRLAKKYQLHGISVFRLGIEDPNIWDTLKDHPWWMFWK